MISLDLSLKLEKNANDNINYDNNNNKIFVKIIKITDEKANPIDLGMFKLSEKDRKSGDVWKGPFKRAPAKRYSTGRL